MSKIEAEGQYFIPIPNTDTNPNWQQTREIPTIHTEFTLPGSHTSYTITYLKFSVTSGKPSGLDILAGGADLETVGGIIRTQMIHTLETSQELLQREDPPPGLVLLIQVISQYFTLRNNGSREQVG